MRRITMFVVCAGLLLATGSAFAQAVPGLQDLVGVSKGEGGYQMQQRNYRYIRTDTKPNGDAYEYWQEQENGQCVKVNVWDDRFTSLFYADFEECRSGGGGSWDQSSESAWDRKDEFQTVCGVIQNGQTYRYRCKAVNFYVDNHIVKTALHWPDLNMRLVWKSGDRAVVHMEGTKPYHVRYTRYEGETDFQIDGKPYFYISDKNLARMEVQGVR